MAKDFVQMDLFSWDPAESSFGGLASGLKAVRDAYSPAQNEEDRRSGICPDWQDCIHKDICFTPENEEHGICFEDEPHKAPGAGPFSRCELKVLAGGFDLVRYTREEKKIEFTRWKLSDQWAEHDPFPTYAAAERKLKELVEAGHIQTGEDGKIVMSGWNKPGRLMSAGFEFYRCYGFHTYDTGCCIKVGSKNWSNLAKYPDRSALRKAWNKLMTEDPKALEG